MKIYTGGTFDVPHAGHVNFFRQIKSMWPNCSLIVSLNTDEFVEKYKGSKALFSYDERLKFLYMTGYVDLVISNVGGEDSKPAILSVNPDVIAIGSDWLEKDYCKQMQFDAKWLREHWITLAYLPYTEGISTTLIKERMNNAR
jgi:glycerol-3-phosphate cytidylyltransferase